MSVETPELIQEDAVEDKMMTEAQLREQNRILTALIHDLAHILDEVLGTLPPEWREVENVKRAMGLTTQLIAMMDTIPRGGVDVSPPPTEFMSGRWHKRAGDEYGILRQPGVRREPDAERDLETDPRL
jgi:hypothetical protein